MAEKRKYSDIESEEEMTAKKSCQLRAAELSPHTWQKEDSSYASELKRVLTDDYTGLKYRRRKGETKTTVHFGQRKLLLSEIEFLTIVCSELETVEKKIVLIYAGAAAGHHIPTLVNAFPFIEYILVDPAKFHIDRSSYKSKVEIRQEYFTDEMAHELKKKYSDHVILFVSDIRTANYRYLTRDMTEFRVEDDMISQMRWYRILDPFKSLLKFRLPYVGNVKTAKTELEYLDGTIYFQVWPGCTSSETRLLVEQNAKMRLYDCVKYEDQLFRFNTVERLLCYKHDVNVPGIDHCYDCSAEVHIITEYTKNYKKICKFIKNNEYQIPELSVAEFIKKINKDLNADSRYILFVIDRVNYGIKFTDFRYGATRKELLTDSAREKGKDVGYDIRSDSNDDGGPKIKPKHHSVHQRINFHNNNHKHKFSSYNRHKSK